MPLPNNGVSVLFLLPRLPPFPFVPAPLRMDVPLYEALAGHEYVIRFLPSCVICFSFANRFPMCMNYGRGFKTGPPSVFHSPRRM